MTDTIDADFVERRALAIREEVRPPSFLDVLRPKDRIAMATEIADAIKDVIVQRGWLKHIGESDHVYVEGWQFVASLAGASCKVVSSEPLPDGKGWQAHAVVVRIDNGVEIGAGSGMCSRAESKWRNRDDYALRSMAETRSMSRALRGVFSFIVELAGYRATPAEEMPDVDTEPLRDKLSGERPRPTPSPVAPPAPSAPTTAELVDLARSLGITDFIAWAATQIDASIADRKSMTPAEKRRAEELLVAMRPGTQTVHVVEGELLDRTGREIVPERAQPQTLGVLFGRLDLRAMKDKETRLRWAASEGVDVDSFSELTEQQAQHLAKRIELIPPVKETPRSRIQRDEDDRFWEAMEAEVAP